MSRSRSSSNKEVTGTVVAATKRRRRRVGAWAAALITTISLLVLMSQVAMAHGAHISYKTSEGVEVTAQYDDGEPMSEAQVTVYAPGEPSEAWLTGTCDEKGEFFFVPDTEIPGTWEVKVRKAGHGGLIRIEVEEGNIESGGSTGFSVLQIVIMSLAVVWGLVGTALFFMRRRKDAHS